MSSQSPLESVPEVGCSVCSQRKQQETVVTMASPSDLRTNETVSMATVALTNSTTDTYQVALTQHTNHSVSPVVTTPDALIHVCISKCKQSLGWKGYLDSTGIYQEMWTNLRVEGVFR